MNITSNNINFKAEYIDKAVIKKRSFIYNKPSEEALVEFDKHDFADRKALKSFINSCGEYSVISGTLSPYDTDKEHIVGITTQKDNFHKIDPDKILGVMKYSEYEDGDIHVSKLQTKPDYQYGFFKILRKYSDVGKTLIEKLKNKENINTIRLFPTKVAIPFYKKLGFSYGDRIEMEWHSADYQK